MSKKNDQEFARLFTLDDGAQVLITQESEDEKYEIRIRTGIDGLCVAANIGFLTWEKLEEGWTKADKKMAITFRNNMTNYIKKQS